MLYLIGLGLNAKGYSKEAWEIITGAHKVYVDTYTIEFPYDFNELTESFKNQKFIPAGREFVEGMKFLDEAKTKDVVLLVYGSPLVATTHTTIIKEAVEKKIKIKIVHAGSILDAVAETGLQPYKFGKTTSLPNFPADSYLQVVKDNIKSGAHTLILVDIGMKMESALEKLETDSKKNKVKLDRVVICSRLGLPDSKILYGSIKDVKGKSIRAPFCFIIPGKLHFMEQEFLEQLV